VLWFNLPNYNQSEILPTDNIFSLKSSFQEQLDAFSTGGFPWQNEVDTCLFSSIYQIFVSFLKHLVNEAQTSTSIIKSVISLCSFHL